jgi:hypothetical protein
MTISIAKYVTYVKFPRKFLFQFGLSQIKPKGKNLTDGKEGAKGTPLWMAPEVKT